MALRFFATASLLILVPVAAHAQTESLVRGQVVAAADRSVLSQAVVTIRSEAFNQPLHTRPDTSGWFSFANLAPGDYVLTASAPGFAAQETRLALEPREVRVITLALEISSVAVDVSVAVRDTALASLHSPSSTVLTSARLETMPVAQLLNLPEALVTLAPGMIRGHDDFVHVRGHEVALNPILNGVSFWENPHSLFSGGVSPDVIETANVMTGGFSAEYGNRFGGVVDIVTKSGFQLEDAATVTLNAGGAGRRSVSGEFGGRRERVAYYVFGGAHGSDRFLSPPDRSAIHNRARGAHAFAQIDGKLAEGTGIRALVMMDGVDFQIPRTPLDLELRPQAEASQRTRQQTAIAGWTQEWANTFMSASAYERWSRSRLAPASGPLTAQARLDRELVTLGGKVDTTASLGRHTIKTGVDLVRLAPRETLDYQYGGYRELTHLLGLPHIHIHGQAIGFAADDAGGQVSGYVQDTFRVGGRVTADLGVRLDHYTLAISATGVSPRANVAVELGRAVMHVSYNRFFVPPPIEGILSSSAGLTRAIQEIGVGLPALEPTREHQVEIGVSAPVGPLSLAVTGYARATDNPVHTTVWPDSRIYSYASFDRARARGLELKAEVPELARLGMTGFLNYALGRVDFYNPVTGGFVTEAAHLADTNRFPAPMDQRHTLTAGWTYSHARSGAWMGTTVEYGSGTPMGHGAGAHEHAETDPAHADAAGSGGAARVPGHFTGNVSLGFDLLRSAGRAPRLSLQVDVQNLADEVYVVAQEGEFSPRQYSLPRVAALTARIRF